MAWPYETRQNFSGSGIWTKVVGGWIVGALSLLGPTKETDREL